MKKRLLLSSAGRVCLCLALPAFIQAGAIADDCAITDFDGVFESPGGTANTANYRIDGQTVQDSITVIANPRKTEEYTAGIQSKNTVSPYRSSSNIFIRHSDSQLMPSFSLKKKSSCLPDVPPLQ